MKNYQLALASLAALGLSFNVAAKVGDVLEISELKKEPWEIGSNFYLEVEEYKGQKIGDKNIYNAISPVMQINVNNPASNWSYFMEYKLSMRDYTTNLHSEEFSYQRNRVLLQATRKMYRGEDFLFNLGVAYRNESYSTKEKGAHKTGNNSYWLIPAGSYRFTDQFSFVFWDVFYYYDNVGKPSTTEWEGEHGFQYKFNDNVTAKLTYYADRSWSHGGDKTDEQNQIRGYFPIKFDKEWELQPYFRFFLDDKKHDVKTHQLKNKADTGGLRVGTVLTYNISDTTSLWANAAWERTEWKNPKSKHTTYGSDNTRDFRLFAIGVRHAW